MYGSEVVRLPLRTVKPCCSAHCCTYNCAKRCTESVLRTLTPYAPIQVSHLRRHSVNVSAEAERARFHQLLTSFRPDATIFEVKLPNSRAKSASVPSTPAATAMHRKRAKHHDAILAAQTRREKQGAKNASDSDGNILSASGGEEVALVEADGKLTGSQERASKRRKVAGSDGVLGAVATRARLDKLAADLGKGGKYRDSSFFLDSEPENK